MVLYLDRMCQCWLHAALWSHISTLMQRLAAEPCSTAGLLFPSWCPSGTILLTPYLIVWDWQVSRTGPMLLYWPKQLYPYYSLLLFFLSLLSVYKLVLWGWGLRTDRMYITLSALHSLPFLIIIITGNPPQLPAVAITTSNSPALGSGNTFLSAEWQTGMSFQLGCRHPSDKLWSQILPYGKII